MKKCFVLFMVLLFSISGLAQNSIDFQVKITNRKSDVVILKNNGNLVKELKVNPDGFFQEQFSVEEGLYQLFNGNSQDDVLLFLKNGYDLKMTTDATNFDGTTQFSGTGANENNYLHAGIVTLKNLDVANWFSLDAASFNEKLTSQKTRDLEALEKAKLDPAFAKLFNMILESNSSGLLQYYTQMSETKKMNNSIAPNFDYENAKGGKTSLESMKGKYVYIDVWATWCGPCRAEIPSLKAIEEKFHGKNIAFVSISVDENKDHEKWLSFVKDKQLGGIQLFADNNWGSDFIKAFSINSIPRFILIDPTGKVIDSNAARPSDPRLESQLSSLLP